MGWGYTLNRKVKLRLWGSRNYRNQLVNLGHVAEMPLQYQESKRKGNDSLTGSMSVLHESS